MVSFWQLSGPDSHFTRNWRVAPGQPVGNGKIALQVFRSLSHKLENGEQAIDLVLGIKTSGASHILLPDGDHIRKALSGLTWRNTVPYPAFRFSSLSPINVGRERFQILLEDRQNVSKSTVASKNRGDNSKANGLFSDEQPRPVRAAFEHCRCFWRILHQTVDPQKYGLPNAPWSRGLDIISVAINFWSADKNTFLDAGMTLIHLPLALGPQEAEKTWYFKSKDSEVLRNPSQKMGGNTPVTWNTLEVDNNDRASIGKKIQAVLAAHSHPHSAPPAPLILLVHDYTTVRDQLTSLGVQTSMWKHGLKELLGYHMSDQTYNHRMKRDPRDLNTQSRTRSCSPPHVGSSTRLFLHDGLFPSTVQSYAPIYIVDTMVMFQTVTGSGDHSGSIDPVDVFNKLTCNNESKESCGGTDAHYIMQSWRAMSAGTSLDEQKAFYMKPTGTLPIPGPESILDTAEDAGLYQMEKSYDIFNDGSDSEADY